MDTKEKRRRRPAPGAAESRRKPVRRGSKTAPRSAQPGKKRVIRAPKEPVPEVRYTAPKPLHRGKFLLKLMSMVAVVVAVMMGLSVFFRVETVMVAGAEQYTPWMIREASGIAEGESLLAISEPRVASRITEKLPYVDKAKVRIRLPGTVIIEITELLVTYAIQDDAGGWWLISSGGRVVEKTTAAQAGSYTRIQGLKMKAPQPDTMAQAAAETLAPETQPSDPTAGTDPTDPTNPLPITQQQEADAKLQALLAILSQLEENRIIGTVSVIDLSDAQDMRLHMGERLVIRLGDSQRIPYKVAYMAAALQQFDAYTSGELDLTLEYMEEALFTPGE